MRDVLLLECRRIKPLPGSVARDQSSLRAGRIYRMRWAEFGLTSIAAKKR